MQLKYINMK